MTGLFGFIPIILLFTMHLKFFVKRERKTFLQNYVGGVLIFISIHMFAEGYIFSAGSGMFFYLWLLLGVVEITNQKKHKLIRKKK